jgi:hypothetical protein
VGPTVPVSLTFWRPPALTPETTKNPLALEKLQNQSVPEKLIALEKLQNQLVPEKLFVLEKT